MKLKVTEEVPTNNAGGGNIHGIGVGPSGEPGGKSALLKSLLSRLKKRRKSSK